MVEELPRSAARSRWAASRSWIEAAVTTTPSSRPFTSTATWRLTRSFSCRRPSRGGVGARCRRRVPSAIDDRRGRAPVPPGSHPQPVAQRVVDALPRPAAWPSGRTPRTRSLLAGTPPAAAATRYHRAPRRGSHPLSPGGNTSRVFRRGLWCCPARQQRLQHRPLSSVSDDEYTAHRCPPASGVGTTDTARSAMMALWVPGLGGDLVITDPTRSRLLRFSARHTPAHRESSNTL